MSESLIPKVIRRKEKTLKEFPSFLRRIATQQSIWHLDFTHPSPHVKLFRSSPIGFEIDLPLLLVAHLIVNLRLFFPGRLFGLGQIYRRGANSMLFFLLELVSLVKSLLGMPIAL